MSAESLYKTSFYGLVQDLVDHWLAWEEHREYYISTLLPQLQGNKGGDAGVDVALVEAIRRTANNGQWKDLPAIVDEVSRDPAKYRHQGLTVGRKILELLEHGDLLAADRLSENEADFISRKEYLRARSRAEIVVAKLSQRERAERLRAKEAAQRKRERQIRAAATKRQALERKAREEALRKNRERELRELAAQREKIKRLLVGALRESITKADALNREVNSKGLVSYEKLKYGYLDKWLSANLKPPYPTGEQIAAIGTMAQSYLLRARAGSGKTSVITAKALLLVKHERIPPNELMILAFNRQAAREVTKRIRKDYGLVEFNNARTFHSLAYRLVKPKCQLLFDESTGSTKRQSEFLQRLLESTLNPAIKEQIYSFFRLEMTELEDLRAFLSRDQYYTYRRNLVQESLRGEHVKSVGEKWIADFLFEHGLSYVYEQIWYWDDKDQGNYRPDFTLATSGPTPNVVIEHWGINLNDKHRSVPGHWDQSWDEYRDLVRRKREFWERHNQDHPDQPVLLLETSISDLRQGREAFERMLAQLLAREGVKVTKLPPHELHERVVYSRIGRFSTMCLQYIQKAKKQRLTPDDLSQKITSQEGTDKRTQIFLTVANSLYRRYQEALAEQNLMDFDDLMAAAIAVVDSNKGRCRIRIEHDRYVAMNSLRWVMIDEYQDFSPLFHGLLTAIRQYNPALKLFCVGDDWQAINAFAGSDLKYFSSFRRIMPGPDVGDLRNNYRSAPRLVRLGNRFMGDKGPPSEATLKETGSQIEVCRTDEIWIEQRSADSFAEARDMDTRFYTWRSVDGEQRMVDPGLKIGRILKKCHRILTDRKYDRSTSFAILSRVERIGYSYHDMQTFRNKLKTTLTPGELRGFGDFEALVHCGTVHSFKGLEADVVILLGVDQRNFPKVHPDNALFSVFGMTPAGVLAEEERLFYVAITRAKRDLYLLTETGRESEYFGRLSSRGKPLSSAQKNPRVRPTKAKERFTRMTRPNSSRHRRY